MDYQNKDLAYKDRKMRNGLDIREPKHAARMRCSCCPYGYHIDLDFVRYCESLTNSQLMPDPTTRRLKNNMRKKRASREALLGLIHFPNLLDQKQSPKVSEDVGDELQRAVMDFEKTLLNTSIPPKELNYYDLRTKDIPSYCTVPREFTRKESDKNIKSCTDGNIIAPNASAVRLQTIRNQLAVSLSRMRELEEKIKTIPELKEKIRVLECELKTAAIESQKDKADIFTSTHDLCCTRTVGTGNIILTRDVGISMSKTLLVSTGTDPIMNDYNETEKTEISLHKIIGSPVKFKQVSVHTMTDPEQIKPKMYNSFTLTDLVGNEIMTNKEVEEMMKMAKKSQSTKGVQVSTSLISGEIENEVQKRLNACQMAQSLPRKIDKSMQTKWYEMQNHIGVQTKEVKIQMKDIGIQLNKCITKNIGSQSKIETANFGINVKPFTNDQFCDAVITTREIGVLADIPDKNKIEIDLKVPLKVEEVIKTSNQTDTSGLIITRDASINTTKKKLVSTGTNSFNIPCKTCASRNLALKTSPTSSTPPPKRPSYLPIRVERLKSPSPPAQVRNEESNSDSGSDDGTYTVLQDPAERKKVDIFDYGHAPRPKSHKKREPSKEMKGAMKVLNDALVKSPGDVPAHMKTAVNIVQQEWFKISSVVTSNPLDVEDYLDCFEETSSSLLEYVVNMSDVTGNTAMHYAVSNGNFDVVSILLDSKVCNINKLNTAGYTSIMLVALTKVKSETDREVVRRLLHMADVNIRAREHGQTALMLAVSHGRIDTVEMLLEAGADINIQDEDGSTALMCAAEHNYIEIVKLLLAQPDCDLSIADFDGSTALSIAMEAGNRDIGVLLYAQQHFSRGSSPYTSLKSKRPKSTTPTLRSRPTTPSQPPKRDEIDPL